MVPKIPVFARQEFNIRAETDNSSMGLHATPCLAQGPLQSILVRQMLEEVARENNVEMVLRQWPRLRRILLDRSDIGSKLRGRGRIQIHAVFPARRDLIDELPPAAAKVEHSGVSRNPSRKEFV